MDLSNCLYHKVPDHMTGDTLYPLNKLSQVHPAIAAIEGKKYSGRDHLMAIKLPILNCLWNDVMHLSPISPVNIKKSLLAAGESPKELPALKFFVIDPLLLSDGKAIHFSNSRDTDGKYDFPESDFSLFDPAQYKELDEVPNEQHDYNKRTLASGVKPLLWARTAHVFYHGSIRIAGLRTIEW